MKSSPDWWIDQPRTIKMWWDGDWFYKMAGNAGMQVNIGYHKELDNLINVVQNWLW